MDDAIAIAQLKQGEIAGLEYLVAKYQGRAVRVSYFISRNHSLAEDMVQAAFLKVYERIAQFDASRPFEPWFLRIVTNDTIKACDRHSSDLSLDQLLSWETQIGTNQGHALLLSQTQAPTYLEPASRLEQSETTQEVWEILGQLPAVQLAAIVQRYYLGYSELEIARRQGVKYPTARWRLHAARERLKILLGANNNRASEKKPKKGREIHTDEQSTTTQP